MEVGRHDDFVISNIVESHLGNIGTYPCSTEQSFGRDASWKANAILNPPIGEVSTRITGACTKREEFATCGVDPEGSCSSIVVSTGRTHINAEARTPINSGFSDDVCFSETLGMTGDFAQKHAEGIVAFDRVAEV